MPYNAEYCDENSLLYFFERREAQRKFLRISIRYMDGFSNNILCKVGCVSEGDTVEISFGIIRNDDFLKT